MPEFPVDDEMNDESEGAGEKPKQPPPSLRSLLNDDDLPPDGEDEKKKKRPPLGTVLIDDGTAAEYKKPKKRPPPRWSQKTYVSVPLLIAICAVLICAGVLLFSMFVTNGSLLCRFTPLCHPPAPTVTARPTLSHDPSPPLNTARIMRDNDANAPDMTATPADYSMPRCDLNADYSNDLMFTMGMGDNNEIFLMTPQGAGLCRLTQNLIEEQQVNWSPDRQHILFTAQRSDDNATDLYVMNFDGTHIVNLTQDQALDSSGVWSPDGQQIAFASNRNGRSHVFIMNADGSDVRDLTPKAFSADSPAWSPDGKQIAYIQAISNDGTTEEVYTVGVDTGVVHQLTNDSSPEYMPAWSPLGGTLVFYANTVSALGDQLGTDLYQLRLNVQGMQRLTGDHSATMPTWSPDGRQIVYLSDFQMQILDMATLKTYSLPTILPVSDPVSWR